MTEEKGHGVTKRIEIELPEGWTVEELEEILRNGAQVIKRFNWREGLVWAGMWTTAILLSLLWIIGPWRIKSAFSRWFEQPYERVVWVTPTPAPYVDPTETPVPTATRFVNLGGDANTYRDRAKLAHDELVEAATLLTSLSSTIDTPDFWTPWGPDHPYDSGRWKKIVEQPLWEDGLALAEIRIQSAGQWLYSSWTPPPHNSSNPLLDTHARLSLAWGELILAHSRLTCFDMANTCSYISPGEWIRKAERNLEQAMAGYNLSLGIGE